MNKKIEDRINEILITLTDRIVDDECMQCVEAVRELLEEFYYISACKSDCKELLDLVMIKHEVKEICEKAKKVIDIYGL